MPGQIDIIRLYSFMNTFWKNNYNVAAVACGALTLLFICFFVAAQRSDINFVYYLISVSAIYSTIQMGFLLQKVLTIRQQKEHLLTNFNELWEAVIHYRYLCALASSYLDQKDHQRYRAASNLKVERRELLIYKFTGDRKDIEPTHLEELQQAMEKHGFDVRYALLVKQIIFFSKDVYKHVNYVNRVYANNNQTINAYIKGMLEDPVFSLMRELAPLPQMDVLVHQIEKHQFYNLFKVKAGLDKVNLLDNLVEVERYLLNQVLFKLHDHTFIIEMPLPRSFMHLLVNSLMILFCGTVLPLFNAFFSVSLTFTLICGALTLGALVLSMTYIALTFYDENNDALFKFTPTIYEGKEER
ncbi:MAG TPA: hypothetical protein VHB54_18620 [Mucilaginibacter sp.]|nr:hypothetical protein [Mucilaginibacter sp.]